MTEFFLLKWEYSERLLAEWWYDISAARTQCTVNPEEHAPMTRRSLENLWGARIDAQVSHDKRDEPVIWTTPFPRCLVHDRFAAELRSLCFKGLRFGPATVRFRNGFVSDEYKRLVVTGWAGIAHPESGVRLLKCCSGCAVREYSPLTKPSRIVDVEQWQGDDFFLVWPLLDYVFVTGRAAECFQSVRVRGCSVRALKLTATKEEIFGWGDGFTVTGLAGALPKILAAKYRRPPEIV
jgi:hypothetical protein